MVKPLYIFTAAPTGLGHIRVLHALQEGLPDDAEFETIGLQNKKAGKIHSLGSRVRLLTAITEFYQTNSFAEWLVSTLLIMYLEQHKKEMIAELRDVAKKHPEKKHWIIVSTHFALAFSIAAHKKEIQEKFGVKIMLCVVVTDDSPQRVWVVKGANFVFAPSAQTAETLVKLGMSPEKVKVISYPVSPRFAQKLSGDELQKVTDQVDPKQDTPLHIVIPVSGAAVQLPYLQQVIQTLSYETFYFTVIGQDTSFTSTFFKKMSQLTHVQTSIGLSNLQTVKYYESLFYQPIRPAVEITKPSEQTFKAILSPNERGGVILLFTAPVERQEKDNVHFLQGHGLIPDDVQQRELEDFLLNDQSPSHEQTMQLQAQAKNWRGVRLPMNSQKAVTFIKKLKQAGILLAMMKCVPKSQLEVSPNGVQMIWNEIHQKFSQD